jgi:hypothetical protein
MIEHRPGTGWMVDRAVTLVERWRPCAVVVDGAGPAGSLIADLEAAKIPEGEKIEVVKPTARQYAQACGALYDAVVPPKEAPEDWAPALRHLDQAPLSVALAGAAKRDLADAWAWARRGVAADVAPIDISPLVAVTLAMWGHATRAHLVDEVVEPWGVWE